MSEQSKEWVLEKVRKLLNLGRNEGATEGERDNAMRMAHKYLAKYNLDMAEAEAHGKTVDEPRGLTRAVFYGRPWARVATAAIAKLYFCEYVYLPAEVAKDTVHFFIGKQSNAIVAASMARYVVDSIQREGFKRNRVEGSGRNEWKRSFCIGASTAVYYRVNAIIAEANKAKAEPGMSLVLASVYASENAKNLVVVKQKFPKMGKGRGGKKTGVNDGVEAGKRYGASIGLNKQVGGATDKVRLT